MNPPTASPRPFATELPDDVRADIDAVMESLRTGIPVAPEVLARVRARSAAITQATYEKHGLLDIGVPSIRELRGELPE
jgi:hypothetical protein